MARNSLLHNDRWLTKSDMQLGSVSDITSCNRGKLSRSVDNVQFFAIGMALQMMDIAHGCLSGKLPEILDKV